MIDTAIAGEPSDPYEAYRVEYRRLIAQVHSVLVRAGRFGGRK